MPRPPPAPPTDPEAEARAERRAFEQAYPMHGVAFHFLAHVFAEPSTEARVVGYMRRGSQFRATEAVPGSDCEEGWHGVPGGGFVCRGVGYLLGETPRDFEPSPPGPELQSPLPYRYAWVTQGGTPQYWRVPTEAEEAEAHRAIEAQRAAASADADAGSGGTGFSSSSLPEEAVASDAGVAPPMDGGRPYPDYVRMPMDKGFFVSLDHEVTEGGRDFWRTVRGGFIASDRLAEVDLEPAPGVLLGGEFRLPVAFVHRDGVRTLRREPVSGNFRFDRKIPRLMALSVADELDHRDRRYVVSTEGQLVNARSVRIARAIERPDDVAVHDRWVHVDLEAQTLVAYEGDRPVYATLVSSGKEGFETPSGLWTMAAKHVSTTMDDLESGDAYLIEDVPWTMFFEGNYALHGAFWHDRFGHRRSHGCVNLAPEDARWLFHWSTPVLPTAWHGVTSDREQPGAFVLITDGPAPTRP